MKPKQRIDISNEEAINGDSLPAGFTNDRRSLIDLQAASRRAKWGPITTRQNAIKMANGPVYVQQASFTANYTALIKPNTGYFVTPGQLAQALLNAQSSGKRGRSDDQSHKNEVIRGPKLPTRKGVVQRPKALK